MSDTLTSREKEAAVEAAEQSLQTVKKVKAEICEVIYGQDAVIDEVLITLLSGGHALLVGVPGLAKTLLVETLGTVL